MDDVAQFCIEEAVLERLAMTDARAPSAVEEAVEAAAPVDDGMQFARDFARGLV